MTMAKADKKQDELFPGFQLWKAANAWQRHVKIALAPAGITHVQYLLLDTLATLGLEKRPATQAQIARAAGIDVMMTSKVLRTLVKKHFVTRKSPRNDARAFSATLTPEGRAVLAKAKQLLQKSEDAFFSDISKRKKFIANLETIASIEAK